MQRARIGRTIVATMALASLTGCATMQGRSAGPHEPGIVMASSYLTKDGGLRVVARVETGTYRLGRASLSYTVSDPGKGAPLAAVGKTTEVDLVQATTEESGVSRSNGEVSFTLDRRALAELADRCLWYRWSVSLEGDSGRVLRSAFYRTSRAEAGLPRAAQVPGPDTAFVVPPPARR